MSKQPRYDQIMAALEDGEPYSAIAKRFRMTKRDVWVYDSVRTHGYPSELPPRQAGPNGGKNMRIFTAHELASHRRPAPRWRIARRAGEGVPHGRQHAQAGAPRQRLLDAQAEPQIGSADPRSGGRIPERRDGQGHPGQVRHRHVHDQQDRQGGDREG